MKWIAFTLLLTGVLAGSGCDRRSSHTAHLTDQNKKEEDAWRAKVKTWAREHDAVEDWATNVIGRGWTGAPFTIDISRALIRSNGQPVLLEMELIDICYEQDGYIARFVEEYKHDFRLFVDLKCTEQQIQSLLAVEATEWTLIARISEVARPQFKVKSLPKDDVGDADVSYSLDVFSAKGLCVELLKRDYTKGGAIVSDTLK